jgi:hypothetical protein
MGQMADPKNPYPTKPDNTSAPAPSQRTKLPARDNFAKARDRAYGLDKEIDPLKRSMVQQDVSPEYIKGLGGTIDKNFTEAMLMHDPDKLQSMRTKWDAVDKAADDAINEKNAYKK